tara:strand:- start:378 stop:773 length:396 start_codon:yes stop_codon:yes gene_type:complete
MHNRKLYLARFTRQSDKFTFYKIGQCWQWDANERFLFENDQYKEFDIKIMTSAWGPAAQVDIWEEKILKQKKKDFWLKGKFSGITEIRQYTYEELQDLFELFATLKTEWYRMRKAGVVESVDTTDLKSVGH